ncbi:Decarboxylase yanB [Colletotrichum siamense]|nr:Decarboxylase yanB [Colletotrichum siamense]
MGRIDTHIHALPPAYVAAVEAAGGDPSGFPSPDWSLEATFSSMNSTSTSIAILSVSAPGPSIAGAGAAGRKLARGLNQHLGNLTTNPKSEQRLGFFGALPDWQDVEGTLAELDFLFGEQKLCFGVTVFTSYGDRLLGHPSFKPIWQKLQAYKALVFTHPTSLDVTPKFIADNLPQPIVDYPMATTRMAVDLVLTGTLRACPDVDVILSHAGGTLPFLANRVMGSLKIPSVEEMLSTDFDTAEADFARFYYDTALSTSPAQLLGLLESVEPSHVLFGSDFPYCPQPVVEMQTQLYDNFVATNPRGAVINPEVLRQNSKALLTMHRQNCNINWDYEASTGRETKI